MGNNDIFSNVSLAMPSKSSTDVKPEKMDNGTIPNSERDVPIVVKERVDRGAVDVFSNELPVSSMNTEDEDVKSLLDEINSLKNEIAKESDVHQKLSGELDEKYQDLENSKKAKAEALNAAKELVRKSKEDLDKIQKENSEFKTKIEDYLILDSSSLYPNFLSAILRANATSNESTAKPTDITKIAVHNNKIITFLSFFSLIINLFSYSIFYLHFYSRIEFCFMSNSFVYKCTFYTFFTHYIKKHLAFYFILKVVGDFL